MRKKSIRRLDHASNIVHRHHQVQKRRPLSSQEHVPGHGRPCRPNPAPRPAPIIFPVPPIAISATANATDISTIAITALVVVVQLGVLHDLSDLYQGPTTTGDPRLGTDRCVLGFRPPFTPLKQPNTTSLRYKQQQGGGDRSQRAEFHFNPSLPASEHTAVSSGLRQSELLFPR